MTASLRELAKQIDHLDRRLRAVGSGNQLAHSAIESGALRAYEGNLQTMIIGRQWDGTYAPGVTNGPIPPTPSDPFVSDATEGLVIGWDGTFALGAFTPAPMDFLRVDAHIGASSGFTPDHTNRVASFVATQGGTLPVTLAYGTYYVKLVCWTLAGSVSLATNPVTGDSWPVEVSTDGFAPASSPAAEAKGGLEVILAKWIPIVNADPVTYEVHISTSSGFTPDSTTLVATTTASQLTIKALPGAAPVNPSDPDPRQILYDTTYYIRIVAKDDDGAAAPGVQASTTIFQITGDNVAADTIRGNHIIGGEITGDKFASTLSVSSAFWTALTGQRAGFTPEGFFAFRPDDSPIFRVPTDGSNAFLDAEMILRGATVTGGLSIQSSQNEVVADAAVTLMRGIVAPSATPQFVHDYEKLLPSTAGLSTAQKTGSLGIFELVPAEVSQLEAHGSYWVIHQVRTNGTRSWFFDLSGNPVLVGGVYFNDVVDWQIYSTCTLTGSAVSARDGVYTMFKWIPDGAWYLSYPGGIAKYSLRNATQTPVIGCNADDIFISEVLANGSLQCNFVRPIGLANVPAAFSVRSTPASCYGSGIQLTAVQWRAGGYGTGAARYYVTQRYNAMANLLVNGSAGGSQVLYPGGSSDNWASANKDAESFESPGVQRRGSAYDGTNFWTYGADGYLYKHSNEFWDPAVTSSKVWGRVTLYDSNAVGGGPYETTPGPAISFTYNRRARLKATLPAPPFNGGTNDPDSIRLYAGRGATSPANGSLWRQYTGLGPTTFTTLTVSGSNPPTVNGFPASNPAKLRNDDDSMYVKGDGSGRFVTLEVGPAGGSSEKVLTEGPFYNGHMAAPTSAITNNTETLITGWTAGDPNETGEVTNYGITVSTGVFTVPKAGWYRINVALVWDNLNATGVREIYIFRGASAGSSSMVGYGIASSAVRPVSAIDREIYLQASGTFRIICKHTAGVSLNLIGDSVGRYSFVNVRYMRS